MKSKAKLILLIIVFSAVLFAAAFLYPRLSASYYETEQLVVEQPPIETAPDFEVIDAEGNAVKLSDKFGRPIVVNFWATWCRFCVQEFPEFDACAKEYGDRVEFMMVDLCDGYSETVDKAAAFIERLGYTFPVYYDTKLSVPKSYDVSAIPVTVLIDKNGALYKTHIGAMNGATLRAYIEKLTEDTK